jgi:sugar phosphate isomerase/epimerase
VKPGVFTVLFGQLFFEPMVERGTEFGLENIERGTGAYPGNAHCDPAKLLADRAALNAFHRRLKDARLTISAPSCHGSPLHPNKRIANQHHAVFEETVRLAHRLDVSVVNVLSGCPGDSPRAKCPNWNICTQPPEYAKALEWQWREAVVPYWKRAAEFAQKRDG